MPVEIAWLSGPPPTPRIPARPADPSRLYRWLWRARLPERRGQVYRVLARGTLNSCLIEFGDGFRAVTSRNALRRVRADA